jgi:hypothetical protein
MSYQSLFNEANNLVAVDDISIDYNNLMQLEVKDDGITTPKIADLAVTNAKINDMDASKLTGTVTIPINTSLVEADLIKVNDGSVGAPSITFKLDPTTGIYRSSIGTLRITSSGIEALRIQNSKITSFVATFHIPDGSVSAPSYSFASAYDLGLYKGGTNTLSVASNNTQVIDFKNDKITSYQNIYEIDGSSTSPSYSFSSATNLGIYKNSANTLSITSNGIEVMRFNFGGNQMYVPLAMGNNSINCGPITSTGQISSATLVVAGSIQGGTTNIGNLFCNNIISSGYFTNTNYVQTPLANIGGTSFLPGVPSKLQIYGSPANISCVSALDNLPVFHIVGNDHNQIGHFMDCYFNGTHAISSSINSNFVFAKNFNELQITTCSGVPPGSPFASARLATSWNTLGNMINYYKTSIGGIRRS